MQKNIELTIPEAIDRPTLEFVDINNDGFYDLIVTTDHRPNNGSQTIYLSEDNGFLESNILSNENGTAVYDYFKKTIVFNTKDDCCSAFNKVIYSFEHGNVIGKKVFLIITQPRKVYPPPVRISLKLNLNHIRF